MASSPTVDGVSRRAENDADERVFVLGSTLRRTSDTASDPTASAIGSVGDAYDKALMETINGLYNDERVRTTIFTTIFVEPPPGRCWQAPSPASSCSPR